MVKCVNGSFQLSKKDKIVKLKLNLNDNEHLNFHLKEAKYAFFSNAHGLFSKVDHMMVHKTSLNKYKKMEIISSIFSDHKGLKLQTNFKQKLKSPL